ncbi:hypothetical protein H8S90_21440 [Olivibacter sp. SDN3]|nr:hypothetical protein H8S90_21440 [Olivibacter sp. SDN3]
MPSFEIEAIINGIPQKVTVKTEETTDGVPYYVCSIAGEQVSEIRNDIDDTWLQLWGNLDKQSVKSIGEEIEKVHH